MPNSLPKDSGRHLAEQPAPTLTHCLSRLGTSSLLLTLALHLLPLLSLPLSLLSFHAGCLFSEPQNPSQASDIYSLELENFCISPSQSKAVW